MHERQRDVAPANQAAGAIEIFRQDTDHGEAFLVQPYRAAEHIRRSAKRALPQCVTEEDDARVSRGLGFLPEKRPAERKLGAEDVEIVRRDAHGPHPPRLA